MSPELHHSRPRAVSVDGIRQKPMFDITGAKIAVIGLDPDGFSLARRAAARGFETIAFDADEVKVAQLEAHEAKKPIRTLSITADPSALRHSDVFMICLSGTGTEPAPLREIEAATVLVGERIREGALVIVESMVFPGVCEHVLMPILERTADLSRPSAEQSEPGFYFAHAPTAGNEQERVIGAADKESLSRTGALYRALGYEVILMHAIKNAEAVRMVEHSLHDVALALCGEFSILFDRIGVDITDVLAAVRSSSVEPTSLSGIGDPRTSAAPYYLARSGHEHQIDQQFLSSARRIVEYMPSYVTSVLTEALRERKIALKDSTIALLGLTDASGTSELGIGSRISNTLEKRAAALRTYDPFITGAGQDLKATLDGADAAVIASDHPMFRSLSPRQFEELGVLIVVDARNCLDKEAFKNSPIRYRGIGRG